jgi:hypothetical protein
MVTFCRLMVQQWFDQDADQQPGEGTACGLPSTRTLSCGVSFVSTVPSVSTSHETLALLK